MRAFAEAWPEGEFVQRVVAQLPWGHNVTLLTNFSRTRELNRRGLAPAGTERFLESLRVMNEAVHGADVDPMSAEQATEIGTAFLAALRAMR